MFPGNGNADPHLQDHCSKLPVKNWSSNDDRHIALQSSYPQILPSFIEHRATYDTLVPRLCASCCGFKGMFDSHFTCCLELISLNVLRARHLYPHFGHDGNECYQDLDEPTEPTTMNLWFPKPYPFCSLYFLSSWVLCVFTFFQTLRLSFFF